VETFVAPAPWYGQPVFARDGSNEIYFYDKPSGQQLQVRAVSLSNYTVRTVVTLTGAQWQEKLEVNADGSLISAHPRMSDNAFRTVIFTPQGTVLGNWGLNGPASDDGGQWHPTDPRRIVASRSGTAAMWHVDSLSRSTLTGMWPAHSALHPNGLWFFTTAYLKDIGTGQDVIAGTGMEPIHPNINPAEASLGADARVTADDRDWFGGGTGRPRLYLPSLQQLTTAARSGNWRVASALAAAHYSRMGNSYGHVHAQWSWDGRYVLWQSDVMDLRDGTPPGGAGRSGATDLFVLPLGGGGTTPPPTDPPPASPSLDVTPSTLGFSAVQGGAAPAAKTVAISNTGGGTLSWSVSESAAWLGVSASAGTGNATISVNVYPAGLAAGTYTGTITVNASGGATGSPKTVGVTLTVTTSPPPANPDQVGPDLTLRDLRLSSSSRSPGQWLTVSFTVVNQGNGTVTPSFRQRVYLSRSATLGSDAVVVGESGSYRKDMRPGDTRPASIMVRVPRTGAGSYHVHVRVDADGSVPESNESNNVGAVPLTITN
jgi:hypothetical protein